MKPVPIPAAVRRLQKAIAAHHGLRLEDILGRRKPREIATPRMIAMAVVREHTRLGDRAIGQLFRRVDSNVAHAAHRIADLRDTCPEIQAEYTFWSTQFTALISPIIPLHNSHPKTQNK